jgi:hypothetical protein
MNGHFGKIDLEQTTNPVSQRQVFRIRLEKENEQQTEWIERLKEKHRQELAEKERELKRQQQQEQQKQRTN